MKILNKNEGIRTRYLIKHVIHSNCEIRILLESMQGGAVSASYHALWVHDPIKVGTVTPFTLILCVNLYIDFKTNG